MIRGDILEYIRTFFFKKKIWKYYELFLAEK